MKIANSLLLSTLLLFCFACHNQREGTFLSLDSSPISYRTFGSGKPLLIINGGPGFSSEGFTNLAKKFSQNYMTILYDQRGTGKSRLIKIDSTTVTLNLMVEDIEQLRIHLQIEKWSILGHSFGGILASAYAAKYPDNIDRIIYSSSAGIDLGFLDDLGASVMSKLSKAETDSLAYWSKKSDEGDTSYVVRLGRGRALAPAYVYDKKFVPIIAERLTQGNNQVNKLVIENLIKIKYDCSEQLKTFDKPVLIIQGKQDIVQLRIAEKAHKVLKNSQIVLMEHCGHYGWLDNEPVYFHEINSFLE